MLRGLRILLSGSALLFCAACPGTLDRPERFIIDAGPACDVEGTFFKKSCGGSGCHETILGDAGVAPANGLDLVSPGVADRITTGKAFACMMLPLQSYILAKVKPGPPCGSPMPLGQDPLKEADLKCLEDYLAKLAPTDGGS